MTGHPPTHLGAIDTSRFPILARGGFSTVFSTDQEGILLKLFKRQKVTEEPIQDPNDHDVIVRAVWDAEVAAYRRAQGDPELTRYSATLHGTATVSEVIDNGGSVTDQYVTDCGYLVERLQGDEHKIGVIVWHDPRIEPIVDRFEESGIAFTGDASCFIAGPAADPKLFDYATWDAWAELSQSLAVNGRLPDHVRSRWGIRELG